MKMHYDEQNNHIYCTNAYNCKENLKALGFRWNHIGKAWFVDCPKDLTAMGNLICDASVDCKMDYADLCEFMCAVSEAKGEFSMDDSHLEKLQAAMSGIWADQISWDD